jgi:hypothetical protein
MVHRKIKILNHEIDIVEDVAITVDAAIATMSMIEYYKAYIAAGEGYGQRDERLLETENHGREGIYSNR